MIFATGLGAPETPRLLPDHSWLVVEMSRERGCVTHLSATGDIVGTIARTGRPNGLIIDHQGFIWVAETHPHPSLLRVTMSGTIDIFADACDGGSFLFPNDLCFGPDGALYMTDSGILFEDWAPNGQVRPDYETASFDGRVYRIDLASKRVSQIDSGLKFANGIAIGPDDNLYVNEMITGVIYRYTLRDGTPTGEREVYGNVLANDWQGGFRGPDGMAFGADGNLYCTVYGQADVTVLDENGVVLTRLPTQGKHPTNIAFGPDMEQRIYVTEAERGQIETFDVNTHGLPLYNGKPANRV